MHHIFYYKLVTGDVMVIFFQPLDAVVCYSIVGFLSNNSMQSAVNIVISRSIDFSFEYICVKNFT